MWRVLRGLAESGRATGDGVSGTVHPTEGEADHLAARSAGLVLLLLPEAQALAEVVHVDAERMADVDERERPLDVVRLEPLLGLEENPLAGPVSGNAGFVTIALIGFLLIGLVSFGLARARLFRPWIAFALAAVDAAAVSVGLFLVLDGVALGGNWLPALPAVWLLPLLMALGAIRYRPWVQLCATALMLLGMTTPLT